jgi:phospholipase A1
MPTPALESLLPAGSGPLARAVLVVRRSLGTSLADRWELEPSTERGRFLLRPYKPMYAMIADWSSERNQLPSSSNPANNAASPLDIKSAEAKFQLSLKTKIWEDLIGDNGDLWLGYTQTSYWQIYHRGQSRPFRESNYEPEIMAVFRTDYSLLGWNGRLAGISLNHQSNGGSEPLSRSWNRLIAQVGLERKNLMVMIRPWWRIPESARTDDNPDIEDYVGRADLLVVRKSEGHELSFLLRHSLRSGNRSRGSLQIGYAFPITSYLKAYAQLFSGYGESLIDYNHRQTRVGVGISLIQWL